MVTHIGSLFSGAGGLDLAAEVVFGGQTVWHSEVDPAASKVLAARWPRVPNLGDITRIDWSIVEPVDILCGGFPCQDVSLAAVDRRRGLAPGTRSNLWVNFALAISALQPAIVIIENVKGLLSAKAHRAMESGESTMGKGSGGPVLRAAGAVLGDLADLGYDAQWATISAASVGSCHGRARVVIVAHPIDSHSPLGSIAAATDEGLQPADVATTAEGVAGNTNAPAGGYGPIALLPTPVANDAKNQSNPPRMRCHSPDLAAVGALLPTPNASDGIGGGPNDPINRLANGHQVQLIDIGMHPGDSELWGRYSRTIQRWEGLTRPAPSPTVPAARGKYGAALNPAFSEWMMGWPDGWVTAVPGISRSDALRIIGDGVCPQQAVAAIRHLMPFTGVQ